VLEGGPLADILRGGTGDDRLAAAGGNDTLEGDGGADALDAGPGLDRVEGGAGDDVAAGGPGRDGMSDYAGHDRYRGEAGADTILAEPADGGAGDDELDGAHLVGGEGDDRLALEPDREDAAVACDAGRDTVEHPPVGLVLPADCERVTPISYVDPEIPVRPVMRGGAVRIWMPFGCNSAPSVAGCRLTATLRVDHRSFGARTVRWRHRRRRELRWHVGRRVQRAIERGALVRFDMVQRELDEAPERGGYSVRLTRSARDARAARACPART
jgi:hypothetical protein